MTGIVISSLKAWICSIQPAIHSVGKLKPARENGSAHAIRFAMCWLAEMSARVQPERRFFPQGKKGPFSVLHSTFVFPRRSCGGFAHAHVDTDLTGRAISLLLLGKQIRGHVVAGAARVQVLGARGTGHEFEGDPKGIGPLARRDHAV